MDNDVIPDIYLCNDLFLLVGGNPLPNYVAAKLLLKPKGRVWLIHSGPDGTGLLADRLAEVLQGEPYRISIAQRIRVNEADGGDIETKIGKAIQPLTGVIGLHYTGGTKAMAVHAYHKIANSRSSVVFSYLDARSLTLKIEPRAGESPQTFRVGTSVTPTLRELTVLHGENLKKGLPSQLQVLPRQAAILADTCSDPEAADQWRSWWTNELLRQRARDRDGRWLPEASLRHTVVQWPTKPEPAVTQLGNTLGVTPGSNFKLGDAADQAGCDSAEELVAWLDGIWLEHYVLDCVREVAAESDIHDYGRTVETARNLAEHHFEVDVAAIRGYQLFALSCTTARDKKWSKYRLFEAMLRARQLGGDEACLGLVTTSSDSEIANLADEVVQKWQAKKNRVRVWGPDTLPWLADDLAEWFKSAA